MTTFLLIAFLALWVSVGTVAVFVVLSAGKLARSRGGDDDMEALADAVREHPPPRPLPRRWTGADWAELERELSR